MRPFRANGVVLWSSGGMVSGGSDGEGVKVVGGDRPGVPGAHPVLAFESGSVESVFAFEVADAAFRADAVAREAALGAPRPWLLAASDEHPLGFQALERFVGRSRLEAAVERDLARAQTEPLQLAGRGRQQRVLLWVAEDHRGGQDEPARAVLGALGDLADLCHIAKFVGLAELALADRPRVRVEHRDQPVRDWLAGEAQLDLRDD